MPPSLRHILTLLCLAASTTQAQPASIHPTDRGLPFYINQYSAHEYGAYPQNWSITQGRNGLIYVGNYDGVLIYDGATWDLVRTPTNTTARSLAAGNDGRIYVGLQGDLGFLESDSSGAVAYTSLVGALPQEERDFRDVWSTHATTDYVYFQTSSSLLRWDGRSFKIWRSETGFHTSFRIDESIYVREVDVGLRRLEGDTLRLVSEGARFANVRIYALDEIDDGLLLVGTREDGLLLFDGRAFRAFETEADSYLMQHRLYHGTALTDGYFALGLLDGGGLIVLDRHGRIISHYTERTGLPDGWVNHVFRDEQGGVWLALNNRGLVRIDPLSQITRFGTEGGLDGVVGDIVRYDGRLYVGTSTGLLRLSESSVSDERARLTRVEGVHVSADVVPFKDRLLITSHDAVRIFDGEQLAVLDVETYFGTEVSDAFPNRFYASSKTGVTLFERRDATWRRDPDFVQLGEEVRRLQEAEDGTLWLVTRSNRVFSVDTAGGSNDVEEYAPNGRALDGRSHLVEIDGTVYLLDESGYISLDRNDTGTPAIDMLDDHISQNTSGSLLALEQAPDGRIWRVYTDRVEISTCRSGCVTVKPEVLKHPDWSYPVNIEVDSSGVAWIASGSTLVRYDPSIDVDKTYDAVFPALIRSVTAIDSNVPLFGRGRSTRDPRPYASEFAFAQNALRFEFALPSFNDPSDNEFQYRLEGRDGDWSEWSKETSRNYTNLWEGTYRFHVRGRNAQGYVSGTSTYSFTILPPWYRSSWAFGVYALGLVGVGLFARRHRRMVVENKRAREQAKALVRERKINERLQDLNTRLEQANETLRQADRLKDEFLANTSHELRTPLTGILGCSAILRDEVDDDHREFVNMIDENSQRLLNTLDSLLDLARLRAGLMELDFEEVELGEKAKTIVQPYVGLASSKGVVVSVDVDEEVRGWFDDHCLESILNHLVANAVKFTDDGEVRIKILERERHVVLHVEDTGVGIDAEFIPFLFDEFKQESTGLTRSHEGNGLGLAVTARIVDLMGGEIDVQSEKHVGSTFIITLPLERENPDLNGQGDALPRGRLQVDAVDRGSDLAAT